ncbi:radical SAM protein [Solidesulfovibrio fructosivorans]|uniref:radical SAM protein n=1 Tax=Solidesulfovibrio fructosivorans TaxID=878 RepID=UPI000308F85D|nr:radical SAM protein [Solidesulfovibrio fructosivorans]
MSETSRARVHFGLDRPEVRDFGGRLPVALAVPGAEGLALSALGWQAVWRLLTDDQALAVERVFCRPDEAPMAEDSGRPLADFPVVAFSLCYEEDYLPAAAALTAADIPLTRDKRPDFPIVMGGGPLAFLNPAPFLPALDLLFVGEAEAGLPEVLAALRRAVLSGADKAACLAAVAHMPGVLVPGVTRTPVARACATDADAATVLADPAHSCFVSGHAAFRDMFLVEVNRGCPYGCRFCAAGYVYRPPRQARMAALQTLIEDVSPRKVGLVGTALTDWPDLLPFLAWLRERGTKFSLSSVRADGITPELLTILRQAGLRTLTLALEAPSERLRRAANKHLSLDALENAVALAGKYGINHLKFYVIVGWPGECPEDFDDLAPLLARVAEAASIGKGKRGVAHATLSVNPLVPKPATPMQWAPMASVAAIEAAYARVREAAKPLPGFRVEVENASMARMQGLLARGDERLFPLIEAAAASGSFRRALKTWDGDEAFYLDRERDKDEVFPWDIVDIGVSRDFLWREWERYQQGVPTAKCPPAGCAVCKRCR